MSQYYFAIEFGTFAGLFDRVQSAKVNIGLFETVLWRLLTWHVVMVPMVC